MLNFIDKYKFGIIATLAAYMIIFVFLQMESYTQYFPITPFHEGPQLDQEEFQLEPEQIEVSPDFAGDIKNMSRDVNDAREKSYEDYYQNKSVKDVEQMVKDYEKSLFEEAGGDKDRERIQAEREEQRKIDAQKPKEKPTNQPAKTGGDKAFAGNVMVDWELANRNPHQDNNWYVRNPGYTCGYGSNGRVSVTIRVNKNGDVTSALIKSSSGANQCMLDQAVKYAKMSRFKYSASAPSIQEGTIIYTFVSQ